jgi:hypothetical protein
LKLDHGQSQLTADARGAWCVTQICYLKLLLTD